MRLQSLNRSWTWYIEILSNMKTKAIVLVAQQNHIYAKYVLRRTLFCVGYPEINISSFMEWLWSVPPLLSVGVQTQSPPLYLPRKLPQLGHEWVTCCMLSTQQGMQAQGQNPTKQRSPPTIQATTLGSDCVLVVTWAWGLVKYMLTRKIWFCDNECPLSRLCKAFVGYSKWPISSHSHSLSFSLSFLLFLWIFLL